MAELFVTGRIVDLVLALVVLEVLVLVFYRQRTARGPTPTTLLSMLVPGVLLLLALRGALVDAHWAWIAGCLLASLIAHLADLRRRWQA